MQWFARFLRSRIAALPLLGVGTALLALAPTDAFAISTGCASVNTGIFNRTVPFMGGGPTTQALALDFEVAEVLTVTWTRQSGVFEFSVNGVIQMSGGVNGTNTGSYTFGATANYTVATRMNGATGPTSVTITCTGINTPGAGTTPLTTPQSPEAARRALFNYYFQFSPESLPGTAGAGGEPDHDHVFEFAGAEATPASGIAWPLSPNAYGPDESPMQDISASGEHGMMLGGVPVNVWGRVKGTLYNGTLGRSGGTGHGVFGAAFGLNQYVDVGVFGHILGGTMRSSAMNASMDSVIGGVGIYAMVKMENRLRFGLSTSHSWGTHTLDAVGGTGRFNTTHWTVDASLAQPFEAGNWVITPMALLAFHRVNFGAYTDSLGRAVGSASDDVLQLSGAVDFAYPVPIDGTWVKTVTPRFNVRVNYFALRADTVNISPLLSLESKSVTVDLSTGLEFALQSGGNLDLAIGATGVGGTLQGYSIRGAFRVPLN